MEPAAAPAAISNPPFVHPRMSREDIDKKFSEKFKDLTEDTNFKKLEEYCFCKLYLESAFVHVDHADQNRYLNAFPNDNHRVVINDGSPQGIYLNISPIYLGEKTYYVGQAPTEKSFLNFHRFLQEPQPEKPKGIQTIVTLTMPKESGRETCYPFWSANINLIRVLSEKVLFNNGVNRIVHRKLAICKDGKKIKEVEHVMLEYWPDGSVVSLECLVKLITIVNELKGGKFVHCSAGLGRSGVFLVAYHAFKTLDYEHMNEMIVRCRIQRRFMVQREGQHSFLTAEFRKFLSNLVIPANVP